MVKQEIQLDVNGKSYSISVFPQETLLEVLRENLGLIGTKEGCSEGECGVCTVLLDGLPVRSCLLLAVDVRGGKITTIEGLSEKGVLHPIQKAFIEHGAIQCGFCTPGMILSAKALLDGNPFPSEEEIRIGLSGNLCRCTGYIKIFKAVQGAAL
ncbi:MAG: (2Fe-2S)-binding protein [Thermodesulfobacteriota bacterium]|nr:(2Fe-2S)-binding protein [Thermodesulfobacteriota bacterium]